MAKRDEYTCIRCQTSTDAVNGTQRYSQLLCRDCFGKAQDNRPKELNDLSGREWASFSRSVEEYPDTRSMKQRDHGACFPVSLAAQHIRMFTKAGEVVFDPFVGVGTTMDAARSLGRKGIGIDLNPKFIQIAQEDLLGTNGDFRLICDDARNMAMYLEPESVDFVLTSPPYSNLLKSVKGAFAYKWREHSRLDPIINPTPYTSSKNDLGNMTYDEFCEAITQVMALCRNVLKPGGYSAWVVKDFRKLKENIPYVNLHNDVITCAERGGLTLWDIRIYDQTRFRPLVCLGYPSKKFYLNIGHSYILIFRKI